MNLNSIYQSLFFIIQLLIAELCFTAGLKKRNRMPAKGLLFLMVYLAFFMNFGPSQAISLANGHIIAAIAMRNTLGWLLSIFGIILCFVCDGRKLLTILTGGYALQNSAYAAGRILGLALMKISESRITPGYRYFVESIFYLMIVVLLNHIIVRKMVVRNGKTQTAELLVLAAGMLFNIIILNSNIDSQHPYRLWLYQLLSMCDGLLILYVMYHEAKSIELIEDMARLEEISAQSNRQYEMLKESMDRTNRTCHDLKHQIAGFRASGYRNEEVLDQMEKTAADYAAFFHTGNDALDVILSDHKLCCNEKGIRFTCIADGTCLSFMKPWDIYTLFGNILDNAIEAADKLKDDRKKIISLSVKQIGYFVHIKQTNYFDGELSFTDGLPATTKEDRFAHGYGIKSIRHITQSYGGHIGIDAADNIYNIDITFSVQ